MGDDHHDRLACDGRFPAAAVLRLIRHAVGERRLDLTGLRVLTEAGVGYARVTPVIAALAGADEVFAVGRDTPQAGRKDAAEQTAWLARLAGVSDRVRLVSTRLQAPLGTIDIVTDLPGVRPIDETIVRNLPSTAVVSLMRGTGRLRPADADVAACRRLGIAVAGVDEEAVGLHSALAMEGIWGLLALGVDIDGATVVVAGTGRAYAHVVRALSALRATVLVAAPDPAGRVRLYGGRRIGERLGDESVISRLAEADALVLCQAETGDRSLASPGGADPAYVAATAPHLGVVSLGAEADRRALAGVHLRTWPSAGDAVAPATVSDLLPRPMVQLHTAGLKVAEVMARARWRGSSPLAAEQLAAREADGDLLPKDLGSRRDR